LSKKKPHQRSKPNRIGLVWFGSDVILKLNRTKPNHIFFYLAVRMTINFKTKPKRTTNTLTWNMIFSFWWNGIWFIFF